MEVTKSIYLNSINNREEAGEISRILHDVWGIRQVEVNLDTKEAVVSYNEDAVALHDFEQALIDGGFQVNTQ